MKISTRIWAPLVVSAATAGFVGYSQRDKITEALLAMNGVDVTAKPVEVNQDEVNNLLMVKAAAGRAKTFLEKHTKDGRLNYGSINRMILGISYDKFGILKDAETESEDTRKLAQKYVDGKATWYEIMGVRAAIKIKTTNRMTESFERFRVDPDTKDEYDDTEIDETNYVTAAALEQYEGDFPLIKAHLDTTVSPGKEVIFPRGFSSKDAEHVVLGKDGLPPGAKVVDRLNNKEALAKK